MNTAMGTRDLAEHLGVSFRQLDYLARTRGPDGADLAGAAGQGSRRVWEPELVQRLQIATALVGQLGGAARNRAWRYVVNAVLATLDPPPAVGWALMDDLGDIHYARDVAGLTRLIARGDGGIVARYAMSNGAH